MVAPRQPQAGSLHTRSRAIQSKVNQEAASRARRADRHPRGWSGRREERTRVGVSHLGQYKMESGSGEREDVGRVARRDAVFDETSALR